MGTTPVPLKILLVQLDKGAEWLKLEAQGHTVHLWGQDSMLPEYDLVMGPWCWRLTERNIKSLALALKEARAESKARKPKKGKK